MTIEEAIKRCKSIRSGARVVLDGGFGTHPGESDLVYRRRIEFADLCISALEAQLKAADMGNPITEDKPLSKLKPCPFCNKDWGISDPDTGRHWLQKINYCPICGKRLYHRAKPANEPLTLDELRQMDGEPVYMVDLTGETLWTRWTIFDRHDDNGFVPRGGGYFRAETYGKAWIAYRTKPEEATP